MGSWRITPRFQKDTEVWQSVTGLDSLHESPESPFYEALMMNPKLKQRLQDVGNIRIVGCLLRKTTGTELNQTKTDHMCRQQN